MNLYEIRKQLSLGIPLINIKLRVTEYARVSTEHKEQISSLNNQVSYFKDMIKKNKNWTYVEGYIDTGISGTTSKRENFLKMLEDAKDNKFDLIITKEISRFSRNTLDSIKYTRQLLEYGVAVFFLNDNINTALPDSELRLTIMSSLAQDEIRRLSERVKFGMKEAIKKGVVLGNNQLYGYSKDKLTKKITVNKKEADVVKRLFIMYAIENKSLTKIANIFNYENLKTRSNKNWTSQTLSRMIKNIKYQGYYCGNKTEIVNFMTKEIRYIPQNEWITYKAEHIIPKIINKNLWIKANNKLNSGKSKKKSTKNNYLYTKKIICKKDSLPYYRRVNNNIIMWYCSNYLKNKKDSCNSPSIKETDLTLILKDIFKNLDLSNLQSFLSKQYKNNVPRKTIASNLKIEKIFPHLINIFLKEIYISKATNITLEIVLTIPLTLKKTTYNLNKRIYHITTSI